MTGSVNLPRWVAGGGFLGMAIAIAERIGLQEQSLAAAAEIIVAAGAAGCAAGLLVGSLLAVLRAK